MVVTLLFADIVGLIATCVLVAPVPLTMVPLFEPPKLGAKLVRLPANVYHIYSFVDWTGFVYTIGACTAIFLLIIDCTQDNAFIDIFIYFVSLNIYNILFS